MKPNTYIRCPRCELNFILKKDKFCNVCKSEMRAGGEVIDFDLDFDICPVCKSNYITGEETICETCAKERAAEKIGSDDSDDWKNYLDENEEQEDDESDSVTISDFDDDDDDFVIPVGEEIDDQIDSADEDDDLDDSDDDLDLDDLDLDDDDDNFQFSDDDDFGDDE